MSLVTPDNLDDLPETPLAPPPAVPSPSTVPVAPVANHRAESLNLAGRPFGNSRPVVRISLFLWLLGAALLVGNILLFRSYLTNSADKRAELERGEEEVVSKQRNVDQLQGSLNNYQLVELNDLIDFLNSQIDTRTFSWSLLLDRLAEVLPNDVRINRLVPLTDAKAEQRAQRDRGSRRGREREKGVMLTINAESRSDEAMSRFVDNLIAHPAFDETNLLRESRGDEGNSTLVRFDVTVTYLPGNPARGVVVEESPAKPASGGRP